ncbi:hypothetical protein ACLK19_01470 [Escherichia coli]
MDEANARPLRQEQWHGFNDADADYMFLIRLKSLFDTWMDETGQMSEEGIPAVLAANSSTNVGL